MALNLSEHSHIETSIVEGPSGPEVPDEVLTEMNPEGWDWALFSAKEGLEDLVRLGNWAKKKLKEGI